MQDSEIKVTARPPLKRSVVGSILLSGPNCSLGYFPFQPVLHNWFNKGRGDLLSKQLMSYAESETISTSSHAGIKRFAENYATVQDYRNAQTNRLEAKVVEPITEYGTICKQMKTKIKANMSALVKEDKAKQKLTKMTVKGDRMLIADSEYERARQDATHHRRELESAMEHFEQRKLADMKKILKEFVTVEMLFHARAIEFLGKCFEDVSQINEEADLSLFQGTMSDIAGVSDLGIGTMSTLGQTDNTFENSTLPPTMDTSYIKDHRIPTVRIESPMYGEDDDDEGDDEESEEENQRTSLRR